MKAAEFFLIIYATIRTANGEFFKYPITINFIKGENNSIKTEKSVKEPTQA